MKKLSVALCLGLGLAFGLARCGAGTDVCGKAANANLLTKVGTCSFGGADGGTDGGFTLSVAPGLLTVCEQAISACSDPDKTHLTSMLDCLGNVTPCVAGKESAFEAAVGGCTFLAAGIGHPCMTSLTNAAPDGGH